MNCDEESKLKALTNIASIDITLNFNDILQNVLKITCETMNAHSGTMMLVDEETNELRMVTAYNLGPDYIERAYEAAKKAGVDITSSPSGTVLKTSKYYLVPNISEEPKDRPWYYLSKELGFSAQIFTPIKRGNQVIGLLNVYMEKPHQFTEEEINFVNIAASQASSVIQNSRLCTRLKNNIHELDQYKGYLEDNLKEAHKKLEKSYEELKESEARYKDLYENAVDAIYINDAGGNILNVNKAGLEKLECTAEEIIGTHASRWFTPESWKLTQDTIRRRILGEPAEDPMIREMVTKSGECLWTEIRSRLIKNGDKVVGFHGIARDVTEKIKMQQELKEYQDKLKMSYERLKESEEKYRELFENAQDPMYVLDTKGNILKMNKVGLQILGCTKEEVIGFNISKWFTPDSLKIVHERQKKRIAGEIVDQMDTLEVVCKNGEHRWAEIKTRDIKNGEKITEIHGIARDVTEKIRLKKEIMCYNKQLKHLWYLILETRGGNTRTLILKHLINRSCNANQLATDLNMDYKTIRHHLDILLKNGIIIMEKDKRSSGIYYLSKAMEANLKEVDLFV